MALAEGSLTIRGILPAPACVVGDHIGGDQWASTSKRNTHPDGAGVASQVQWAQANPPDYSYKAFCRNAKALGCAGYIVSFSGRRVLYIGRTAETHVEHFPQ